MIPTPPRGRGEATDTPEVTHEGEERDGHVNEERAAVHGETDQIAGRITLWGSCTVLG